MSKHKPFCLTANLLTPLVIKRSSINLASLLYHACWLHTHDQQKATELLNSLLVRTDGLHHGSNMTFGVKPSSPLIALELKTVGRMVQETDLSKSLLLPNGRGNKYIKVITNGGVYKTRFETHKAYHSSMVHFYGNGDGYAIAELLNHYVGALGVYANRGSGTISEFTCEPVKDDWSITRPKANGSNELMRSIRADFASTTGIDLEDYEITKGKVIPPFYCGEQTDVYSPTAVLLTRHKAN